MSAFVVMSKVEPRHECGASGFPPTCDFGLGSIVRCECGRYFMLGRDFVTDSKLWKAITDDKAMERMRRNDVQVV